MVAKRRSKVRISPLEIFLLILSLLLIAGAAYIFTRGPDNVSRIEVMEYRLRELRQLQTVSQTFRSVIYVEEKNFWRGNKQVLFTLEYIVTAGVDFSEGLQIRENPDGTLHVRMPQGEIFSSDADETSIRQMFLREQALLNPVRMGDYIPQVIAQGEANKQAALEGGILDMAEANARQAVIRILNLGEFENISFDLNREPLADG